MTASPPQRFCRTSSTLLENRNSRRTGEGSYSRTVASASQAAIPPPQRAQRGGGDRAKRGGGGCRLDPRQDQAHDAVGDRVSIGENRVGGDPQNLNARRTKPTLFLFVPLRTIFGLVNPTVDLNGEVRLSRRNRPRMGGSDAGQNAGMSAARSRNRLQSFASGADWLRRSLRASDTVFGGVLIGAAAPSTVLRTVPPPPLRRRGNATRDCSICRVPRNAGEGGPREAPWRGLARRRPYAALAFGFSQPRLARTSAICTAFSAAPFRRLSETHQRLRPFSIVGSSRMRLM
jgi:hypothetical protein